MIAILLEGQNVSFAAKNLKVAAAQDIVPRSAETQLSIKMNMLESVSVASISSAITKKGLAGMPTVNVIAEIHVLLGMTL